MPFPAAARNVLQETRLDRWLLAERVFKTRPDCATACEAGRVRVNGNVAKAHRAVRAGDRVEARTRAGERILIVRALDVRRRSAEEARLLFEDLSPPPPPAEARREADFARAAGAGRPTKRDRRRLTRLRG